MFELELSETKMFKELFGVIAPMIDCTNLEFTEETICLQSMDSSHVALVNLFLDGPKFDRYICKKAGTIGISIITLKSHFLDQVKPQDSLIWTSKENGEELECVWKNLEKKRMDESKSN